VPGLLPGLPSGQRSGAIRAGSMLRSQTSWIAETLSQVTWSVTPMRSICVTVGTSRSSCGSTGWSRDLPSKRLTFGSSLFLRPPFRESPRPARTRLLSRGWAAVCYLPRRNVGNRHIARPAQA
jgi:hypothetical protein